MNLLFIGNIVGERKHKDFGVNGFLLGPVALAIVLTSGLLMGEEARRFRLDLNRPPPKVGESTKRISKLSYRMDVTNSMPGREYITNLVRFVSLESREQISIWDVTNEWAETELTIDRLLWADHGQTNELVKPGTRVSTKSIAGQMLVRSKDAVIPLRARQLLEQSSNIRAPKEGALDCLELAKPRVIGEKWNVDCPLNIDALGSGFGQFILRNLATSDVKRIVHFFGTTNVLGIDCFHLRIVGTLVGNELSPLLQALSFPGVVTDARLTVDSTIDIVMPFDPSSRLLVKIHTARVSISGEATVDGTIVVFKTGGDIKSEDQILPSRD